MRESSNPHVWVYRGVGFYVTDKLLPGSGAKDIEYYDVYFCSRCTALITTKLEANSSSYEPIRYNATPVQPKDTKNSSCVPTQTTPIRIVD
jgi:hypothetical protein